MVNLVVRHSHLQGATLPTRSKSPAIAIRQPSPKPSPRAHNSTQYAANVAPSGQHGRVVPSPIRIPSTYRQAYRAVSPLTTTESMFDSTVNMTAHEDSRIRDSIGMNMGLGGGVGAAPRDARDPRDPSAASIGSSASSPNNKKNHLHSPAVSRGRSSRDQTPLGGRRSRASTPQRSVQDAPGHSSSANSGDLTCDYDSNVTPLYEMLESSHWDKARHRCRTHISEVRTWIVRKDQKSNKIRWKLLPLHAAVIFQAPTMVVATMLEQYPSAASRRDDQGMLPLHLAFRHKQQDETLLELLLDQYPQGVSVKDRRDRLPLDHGKDIQFSSKLMQLYAQAHARCAQPTNNAPSPEVLRDQQEQLKAKYDKQIENLKAMHEERIESLIREHNSAMDDMRRQFEQDQRLSRTQHDTEMDELRDLLSREVGGGQRRAGELELDVQDLKLSLSQANQETEMLRSTCHNQKVFEEELKDQFRQVLIDQKNLQELCAQQQAQLDQARQVREQLLRTLLQKEGDSKAARTAMEMGDVSQGLVMRMENILSRPTQSNSGDPSGLVDVVGAAAAGNLVSKGQIDVTGMGNDTAIDNGLANGHLHGHHHHNDQASSEWEQQHHELNHDDDISAITENSNF